jgi:shikimate kinase
MPGKNEVLVLVGPMGVGKTTIGKKLAKLLSVNFSDTDAIFTAAHGPIDEFFAEHGEAKFREFETLALREAISLPGVVATGGGAVLSDESKALLATTTVIYLATDGKHIASRLTHGNRPLLKNGMSDWRRIYDARKSTYEQVADFTVDTSSTPLATTIAQIREKVGL